MQPFVVSGGTWSPWEPGVISLLVYALFVLLLVGVLLLIPRVLGKKAPTPEKARAYEGGVIPTGSARFPYPIPFYLIAAFFLIFDVEALYIFSWAIAAGPLGWAGWLQISFFIMVLLISLFYVWGKGGLEWGPKYPKNPSRSKMRS